MEKELKDALEKIKDPNSDVIKETYKLGFMACIRSIEDKGFEGLSERLREEHSKI